MHVWNKSLCDALSRQYLQAPCLARCPENVDERLGEVEPASSISFGKHAGYGCKRHRQRGIYGFPGKTGYENLLISFHTLGIEQLV